MQEIPQQRVITIFGYLELNLSQNARPEVGGWGSRIARD